MIVMPIAGNGRRVGGDIPKPLVPVGGKPMVQVAVENIAIDDRWVFVGQRAHDDRFGLSDVLRRIVPDCDIVLVNDTPPGPAASVLAARPLIGDEPLLIVNCDQWVDWSSRAFLSAAAGVDGLIAVHHSTDPRFSYAETVGGWVTRTAEKDPISTEATCGIYWWRSGTMFLEAADRMVAADDRVNGEFYVAPAYNHAIAAGARVRTYEVKGMHDMGTAEGIAAWR